MTTDLLQSTYRQAWWGLVLRGLVGIALGVMILWRPLESIAAFALFIAIWSMTGGLVQIVSAFELRKVFDRWWVGLLGGVVSVGFGVAAIYYYPGLSLAFATLLTAWWLLLTGGISIYGAMVEHKIGASWGWTLVFGILSVACGVLALMSPPATLAALMGIIAGFAIVSGIALLIGASRLASVKREVSAMLGAPARR